MNKVSKVKGRTNNVIPWQAVCGECGTLSYCGRPLLHRTRKQAKDLLHDHMVETHAKAGQSHRG